MQSALKLSVSSQLDKHGLVERQAHQIERLTQVARSRIVDLSHDAASDAWRRCYAELLALLPRSRNRQQARTDQRLPAPPPHRFSTALSQSGARPANSLAFHLFHHLRCSSWCCKLMASLAIRLCTREIRSILSLATRHRSASQERAPWSTVTTCSYASKRRKYTIDADATSLPFLQSLQRRRAEDDRKAQIPPGPPLDGDGAWISPTEAGESFSSSGQHEAAAAADQQLADRNNRFGSTIREAIASSDVDAIIRTLHAINDSNSSSSLASLTDDEFSTVLDIIRPQALLGDKLEIQLSMRPRTVNFLHLPDLDQIIGEYLTLLELTVDLRRRSGSRLSFRHYTQLLHSTAYLHARAPAEQLWQMLTDDGCTPDVHAFNAYLGSVIWERTKNSRDVRKTHAFSFNLLKRQRPDLPFHMNSYRVGENGIWQVATRILDSMANHAIAPNADTYAIYIRAAGLEGKIDWVGDLLEEIWQINVPAILADQIPPEPKRTTPRDPLHPTSQLLFDVAHAYCNSGDFHAALKLVSYISREYDLEIGAQTWAELLAQAFVFSIPLREYETTKRELRLEKGTMEAIWETMTGPPYNIEPSPSTADLLIRIYFRYDKAIDSYPIMEHYRIRFLNTTMTERDAAWAALQYCLAQSASFKTKPHSAALSYAVARYDKAYLRYHQEVKRFEFWTSYILGNVGRNEKGNQDLDLECRVVPRMLETWKCYGPRCIRYCIPTGLVEMDLGWDWKNDRPGEQISYQQRRFAYAVSERLPNFSGQMPSINLELSNASYPPLEIEDEDEY